MPKAAVKKTASKTAPAFNGSAAPDGFDCEAEIRKIWQMFPDIREKVYFVDLLKDRLLYPGNPEREEKLNEALRENHPVQTRMLEYRRDYKSSACLRTEGKRYVLLYTGSNPDLLWERFMPLSQINTFILDHEMAHATVRDATGDIDPNLAECIADTYATMRHFQRYGTESRTIDGLAEWRAARFVFGNVVNQAGKRHFTSPVVEQVLARRDEIAWDQLSPQETAELARRFALMYAPHRVLLERLDECFHSCHTPMGTPVKADVANLSNLVRMLEEEDFAPAVKCGAMALKFFAAEADAHPDIEAARARIAQKAERLQNMDEILSGFEDKAIGPKPRHRVVIANRP